MHAFIWYIHTYGIHINLDAEFTIGKISLGQLKNQTHALKLVLHKYVYIIYANMVKLRRKSIKKEFVVYAEVPDMK